MPPNSAAMEGILPASTMAIPVGTQGARGYKDYVVEVLGAIPSGIRK